MKVVIKTIKGKKTEIECEPTTLISEIKKQIETQMQIDPDNQKLIFKGKHLADEKSLQELSIKHMDCFVLMVLKKKTLKKKIPKPEPELPVPVQTTPEIQPPTNPFETPQVQPQPQTPPITPAQPTPEQVDPNNEIIQGHSQKEELIKELIEMGFPRPQVEQCLTAAFYNKEMTVNYLLNGIPQHILDDITAPPQPQQGQNQGQGQQQVQMTQQQLQTIQQLANSPAFVQLRQQAQANPQVIPQFLQILQQQNPSLYNLFVQNPQLLTALLTGNVQVQGQGQNLPQTQTQGQAQPQTQNQGNLEVPNLPQGNGGENVVELSDEDYEAIQVLKSFGFNEQQCIEAYLVCGKNQELAVNYLLDNQGGNAQN